MVFNANDGGFMTVSHLGNIGFVQNDLGVEVSKVSQNGVVVWQKAVVGLNGNHLTASKIADGYLRIGSLVSNEAPFEARMVTIDDDGEPLNSFSITLPGLESKDLVGIKTLSDGGAFFAYRRTDSIEGVQCFRYDKIGTQVNETFMKCSYPLISEWQIMEMPDGNISINYFDFNLKKMFFSQISKAGQVLWNKEGPSGLTVCFGMKPIFMGYGKIGFGSGFTNMGSNYLICLDSETGDLIWQNNYDTLPEKIEFQEAISDGNGGLIIIASNYGAGVGGYLTRISGDGQVIFEKPIEILATKLAQTLDGHFVLGGVIYTTYANGPSIAERVAWLKFDEIGDSIWQTYGSMSSITGAFVPVSFVFDSEENLISFGYAEVFNGIVPYSYSYLPPVNHIAKLTPNGQITTNAHAIDEIEPIISVFPNPANSNLKIQFNGDALQQSVAYSITSLDGGLIRSATFSSSTGTEIDVSAIPTGIYFIEFTQQLRRIATQKLTVQH